MFLFLSILISVIEKERKNVKLGGQGDKEDLGGERNMIKHIV